MAIFFYYLFCKVDKITEDSEVFHEFVAFRLSLANKIMASVFDASWK
jgi:hypothetical protein